MAGMQPARKQLTGYAVAYSSGIRKIRHINSFLGVNGVVSPWQASRRALQVTCVVVWGRKHNTLPALRYAARHDLPLRYIEDGWIRSCSANAHSRISYSLLVDEQGVYYDSSVPSALETYLNETDEDFDKLCDVRELAYAKQCRQILIDNDITKYNFVRQPNPSALNCDDRALVLVLDQTCDDASVRFGGMDAASFNAMLDRAIQENPDARVVVRTHPDVVAGHRQGYLQRRANNLGVEISAAGDNPIPWLKAASLVYVGTSQLGYEALLCGCKVKVSGQPFYAGWGLTEDIKPIERRIRTRTLDQLFHATHVQHARYCCPVTGRRWALHDCLEHVKLQQQYFRINAGERVAIGITPWKRRYIAQFLRSPDGKLRFSAKNNLCVGEVPMRWSYSDTRHVQGEPGSLAKETGLQLSQCIRIEDGFIRSRGLGSDYSAPASLVFDPLSLYFDASKPSFLENLLNSYDCSEVELRRAAALRRSLLAANLTKYNVGSLAPTLKKPGSVDARAKTILVIGQVEGDQSLLRGGCDVRSNSKLLETVREKNPGAHIVYKPHPDVVSGNKQGAVGSNVMTYCVDKVEPASHLLSCLKACDEVHTMTSLSGFEALLRGKPVVTYGLPFYAGWGLTQDFYSCQRRTAERSLDELVYLCLVVYPHYVDLPSGEFVTIEQLVEKLNADALRVSDKAGPRWLRKLSNIAAALTYRM